MDHGPCPYCGLLYMVNYWGHIERCPKEQVRLRLKPNKSQLKWG